MTRRYGMGTGLPEQAPFQDEGDFRKFNPLYQAISGLAKATSDAVGLTSIDSDELQNTGPFIEFNGNLGRRMNFEAGEQIEPARLIYLDTSAGESRIWHVSSQSGINRVAHGFCLEPVATTAGRRCRVMLFSGLLAGISGVTPGTIYWLGVNGQLSAVMPVTAGWTQQKVAIGLTANAVMVQISL